MKTSLLTIYACLFSIVFLSCGHSAKAQVTLDGNNCEWPVNADVVDTGDVGGIPSTSDLSRFWFARSTTDIYMAFSRKVNLNGAASFSIYLDLDVDSTSGDLDQGGADGAMFFNVSTTAIVNVKYYAWDTATSGFKVDTSVHYTVVMGDSNCTGATQTFFEIGMPIAALYDPCNIGNGTGQIRITNAAAHSGKVFNSSLVDTLKVNNYFFVNNKPSINLDAGPYTLCSGDTITLDAKSNSTPNTNGTSPVDSIMRCEWDINYNGNFTVDYVGNTLDQTFIQFNDSTVHNYAVVVVDAFGCTDTLEDIKVISYALPTAFISFSVDTNYSFCRDYVWTYKVLHSADYKDSALASLIWYFPDNDTALGDSVTHVYSPQCLYNMSNQDVTLVGIDDKGCKVDVTFHSYLSAELPEISAFRQESDVKIEWSVPHSDLLDVCIQRSDDGITYQDLQCEDLSSLHSFNGSKSYSDVNAPETSLIYRLKVTPLQGDVIYSSSVIVGPKSTYPSNWLYPNPAMDVLNIALDGVEDGFALTIMNQQGQMVYDRPYTHERQISVADLQRGIYFVQIISDKGVFTQRVVLL